MGIVEIPAVRLVAARNTLEGNPFPTELEHVVVSAQAAEGLPHLAE
jgi:hypothetical protein